MQEHQKLNSDMDVEQLDADSMSDANDLTLGGQGTLDDKRDVSEIARIYRTKSIWSIVIRLNSGIPFGLKLVSQMFTALLVSFRKF